MKILFIFEAQKNSANANITKLIASQLKRMNHIVDAGYFLNVTNDVADNDNIFNKKFIVQDNRTQKFILQRETIDWLSMDSITKIMYCIHYPNYMVNYLIYSLGSFALKKKWIRRIEQFCKSENIDVVIGVSFPFDISRLVSQVRGVKYKCLISLDPYAYNSMLPKKKKNKRLIDEKDVIERCFRVFTTDLIKMDLIKNEEMKKLSDRIVTIEFPLINDESRVNKKTDKRIISNKQGEIAFLHPGTFYPDIRNPEKLVRLFEKLPDNYMLYVAGHNSYEILKYSNKINNRVIDLGCLDKTQIQQAMQEADFLICYNNTTYNQVPSKLFDCINTGKPILNLCQIHNCPTLKYVENYEYSYTLYTDTYSDYLCDFCKFVETKKGLICDKSDILKLFEQCTIKFVTEIIEKELV
ncbi:MAG: glycosyltransferase family 4 protein [Pseudobutyrivibrio ruminis]|uniref:hypothetical protein n=1 Tax=Pseudobutyrivibrio ruminis TaxID=46206 RepID=UPI0026F3466B|nr:hypothetical protein [Pseudobutyrivibrio ruminis]MBE5912921.1 glycosyltransferase family 4 protein [Pseudobutyrivibrio ruminis]